MFRQDKMYNEKVDFSTKGYGNHHHDHYYRIGQGFCSRFHPSTITTLSVDQSHDLVWAGTNQGFIKSFEFRRNEYTYPIHRSFTCIREEPIIRICPLVTSIYSFSRSGYSVHNRDGIMVGSNLNKKYITDTVFHRGHFFTSSINSPIIEWDPEKLSDCEFPSSTKGVQSVRVTGKFLVSGLKNGNIRVWDIENRKPISSTLQVHTGKISDVCVGHNFIVTCGKVKRYGRMEHDQLVKVFDIRTFRLINQMRFKQYASFLRFHPFLPSTICICSKSLGFQFRNIDNQFLVPTMHYVQSKGGGGQTSAFELALSGEIVVLGNSRGEVSFWSSSETPRLHNRHVGSLEFVNEHTDNKDGYRSKDVALNMGVVPTYVNESSEPLLSDVHELENKKFIVGQHGARIHPIIEEAAELSKIEKHVLNRTEFPIFRNPGMTSMDEGYIHIRRSHSREQGVMYYYLPYQDKYVKSTLDKIQVVPNTHCYERFIKKGERAGGAMGIDELERELNGEKVLEMGPIKFIGLRNDYDNSNINAVIQTLYHLCPDQIRTSIMSHLCFEKDDCFACHLGFLFTYMTQVWNNTNNMDHRKRIFYPSFFMRALHRRINMSNLKKLKMETSLHYYFRVFIGLLVEDLSPVVNNKKKKSSDTEKLKNIEEEEEEEKKKKKTPDSKNNNESQETKDNDNNNKNHEEEEEGEEEEEKKESSSSIRRRSDGDEEEDEEEDGKIQNFIKYLFEGERVNWFRCKKCGHLDERDVFSTNFIDLVIPKKAQKRGYGGHPPSVSYFTILDQNTVDLEFSLMNSGSSMAYISFRNILENSFTRFERMVENYCSKCAQSSKFPMFSSYKTLPRILSMFINYRFLDWLRIQHQINGLVGKNNHISLPSKIIVRKNPEKKDWDVECVFENRESLNVSNREKSQQKPHQYHHRNHRHPHPHQQQQRNHHHRHPHHHKQQKQQQRFSTSNNDKPNKPSYQKKNTNKATKTKKKGEYDNDNDNDDDDDDDIEYVYELRSILTTIVDPFYHHDEKRYGKGSLHHPVTFVKVDISRPFETTSRPNFEEDKRREDGISNNNNGGGGSGNENGMYHQRNPYQQEMMGGGGGGYHNNNNDNNGNSNNNNNNNNNDGSSTSNHSNGINNNIGNNGGDNNSNNEFSMRNEEDWYWYLFNDHRMFPQLPENVFDFSSGQSWKVPNILFYVQTSPELPRTKYKNPILAPSLEKKYETLKLDTILPSVTRVALDAEFVLVKPSIYSNNQPFHSVGRVSITDENGEVIMDDVVDRKEDVVVNYLTEYSGLKRGDLDRGGQSRFESMVTLKEVYVKVRALVDRGVRVVGHGLENDFRNLLLWVDNKHVDDTVFIYRLGNTGRLLSLAWLTRRLLQKVIQEKTHCSVEDAKASLGLFKLSQKLKKQQSFQHVLQSLYEIGQKDNWRV